MGERASTSLPKQFAMIAGKPMLTWSFNVLRDGGCTPIVVVAPEQHMERTRAALAEQTDAVFAYGGKTRQDSVRAGLEQVRADTVVIHDAARPFASSSSVQDAVRALDTADGAVVAIPVEDTIKQVVDDRVVSTIDRSPLWRSQTPQAFKTRVLREAHVKAQADGFTATDDAELVERAGGRVVVVVGSAANIKITQPSDLELAQLLATREDL